MPHLGKSFLMVGVGVATDCRISKLVCRRTQIFLNSLEGRKCNTCRSPRFIKNVYRSSRINFFIPQKKEQIIKQVSLKVH